MNFIGKMKRYFAFKQYQIFWYKKAKWKHRIRETEEFLKQFKNKKILMVNASPLEKKRLQQRPHHFVHFWKDYFDVVLYISYTVDEPVRIADNVYAVSHLPVIKNSDNDNYFYFSCTSCISPKSFKLLKKCDYKIIYDYYDDIVIYKSLTAKIFHRNLKKLRPDVFITSAEKLYNDVKKTGSAQNLILVKNGVTLEDFQKPVDVIPDDLQPVLSEKKPIVGFYGDISHWLYLKLVERCLQKYPQYNFVFLGVISSGISIKFLKKYENFHFLGHKNYYDLYKYSSFFNSAIIPFKYGNIAKSTSPNKLFEYMALGIPVVCTRDLNECRGYTGVLVSENDEQFIANIEKAVELSKNPEIKKTLKAYAFENQWKTKANIILDEIKKLK